MKSRTDGLPGPSPAVLDEARLDDEVAASAPPIAGGGGLLMVLVGLAHLIVLPPSYRMPLAWLTLATAVVLLGLYGVLRRWRPPRGSGNAAVVGLGALLLVPGVALVAWSQAPRETVNLMLVVLGGGVVLLSFGWLLVLMGLAWFSFSAVVTVARPHPEWVHFGSAFVAVSVMSLVLVAIHRRMHERLFSREAALAATLQDLQRSNEALEQFAFAVSHDLQAPIRAIEGYVEALRQDGGGRLGGESLEALDHVQASTRHMGDLVHDLLEYSRVGSRGAPFQSVPLDRALDQAVVNLSSEVSRLGATLTREPLPPVAGDLTQLTQLFQNLLGNALKFHGSDAPRVHVATRREGEGVVVSVTDNGIGVAPEHHERVFRVFERLHASSAYPGTGIGLATCRRVVERHGGRIWIESAEGQGATFSFWLPG